MRGRAIEKTPEPVVHRNQDVQQLIQSFSMVRERTEVEAVERVAMAKSTFRSMMKGKRAYDRASQAKAKKLSDYQRKLVAEGARSSHACNLKLHAATEALKLLPERRPQLEAKVAALADLRTRFTAVERKSSKRAALEVCSEYAKTSPQQLWAVRDLALTELQRPDHDPTLRETVWQVHWQTAAEIGGPVDTAIAAVSLCASPELRATEAYFFSRNSGQDLELGSPRRRAEEALQRAPEAHTTEKLAERYYQAELDAVFASTAEATAQSRERARDAAVMLLVAREFEADPQDRSEATTQPAIRLRDPEATIRDLPSPDHQAAAATRDEQTPVVRNFVLNAED